MSYDESGSQEGDHVTLKQDLREALGKGEISMHYQPVVKLTTNEIVGFEALMRWQHPQYGYVPPKVFIPEAETNQLIDELGRFALREAIVAAKTWKSVRSKADGPFVSVNVSAQQLEDSDLVPFVEETMHEVGLAPHSLILEITESVAMLDTRKAIGVVEKFDHLGVLIALDRFGGGFSSVSYLAQLNPKLVKIDQTFIRTGQGSIRHDALLQTIVSLLRNLGITMVAVGIESAQQCERLRDLQCGLGQGYFFSPAVTAAQARSMIGSSGGQRAWISRIRGLTSRSTNNYGRGTAPS
jgi:EAL domain-containing protein (putative c-di-GMP-specific phosphodiesterase class I)